MLAATRIRVAIGRIAVGKLFTTRQFLACGSRGAVDQCLYLLVKSGEIIRVARGVFMRKGSPQPSVLSVARKKAAAFGKRIFEHGADTAVELTLLQSGNQTPVFACTGRSSSFRCGDATIRLQGTSPRKLHGEDCLVGRVIRALWHLGKESCWQALGHDVYPLWSKVYEDIKQAASLLPAWMNHELGWSRAEVRLRRKSAGDAGPLFLDLGKELPEFASLFDQINKAL